MHIYYDTLQYINAPYKSRVALPEQEDLQEEASGNLAVVTPHVENYVTVCFNF